MSGLGVIGGFDDLDGRDDYNSCGGFEEFCFFDSFESGKEYKTDLSLVGNVGNPSRVEFLNTPCLSVGVVLFNLGVRE